MFYRPAHPLQNLVHGLPIELFRLEFAASPTHIMSVFLMTEIEDDVQDLLTWRGTLLDGHNRLGICTRLGITYKTCEIEMPNREAAKLWIEVNQLGRRNLLPDQRAAIAFRILQRRVAISKRERARKGGPAGGAGRSRISLVVASSTKQERPRQRKIAAAQLGVPSRKLRMVSMLAKQRPDVVERIVSGRPNITAAHKWGAKKVIDARIKWAMRSHPDDSFGIFTGDISKLP